MGLLGGLASGLFNVISQGMANTANMNAIRENNAFQRQMSEYEWSKNLEMWNLQNQYNSPASQMARFKAAGLNPNLIYSQGNPGNASSMPSYQSPTSQPVTRNAVRMSKLSGVLDLLQKYQNIKIGQIQGDKIRSEIQSIDESRLFTNARRLEFGKHQSAYNQLLRDKVMADIRMAKLKAINQRRINDFWEKYGVSPNSEVGTVIGGAEKLLQFIGGGLSKWGQNRLDRYYNDREFGLPFTGGF